MPKLTATPEMKQAAIADEPKQHEGPYGYRYVERTYYPYMNCVVQDGILKAAFYLPEHLRLDGNNPAYEVFLDKKAHQFLTYDHLEKKWRDAKLDRLNWPGRNYYATCWASEKDAAVVQDYLCGERGGDLGILDFQRNVRDEQLEQRHKRITGAWDQDLAQVPELPKDWMRWIDKVAVRENFIFYRYKRGGAQNGYCTFCGKEVPISGHPYHNKKGRCACCRHPIVFKALGRAGYIRTEKDYAYLIQRCKDGFVLREFWAERTYWKDSLPSGKPYWHEFRRSIYDRSGEIRSYYWGVYCQRETRWISGNPCYYSYCGNQTGRVYGKSLPCMEQKELFGTGLVQWIRTHPVTDPEKYLAVWKRMPKMEQIWKADLPRLTKECFEHAPELQQTPDSFHGKDDTIVYDHVSFGYTKTQPGPDGKPMVVEDEVLHDISFTAKAGQKTALVGESGSGKSTLAKLLIHYYDAQKGSISIGGQKLCDMSLEALNSRISYVAQDQYLFNTSLLENIRMGRLNATDEEVLEAARKAQCMEFLEKLPQGIHSMAGDAGKMLSGGQRQRISLARAILKDAPIVVLDEATAYADPENEEKMEAAIAELVKDKTLVVIAHKLPAIMNADQICVVDHGKLVAAGKHQDLIQSCPEYQKLWKAAQDSAEWNIHTAKEGN